MSTRPTRRPVLTLQSLETRINPVKLNVRSLLSGATAPYAAGTSITTQSFGNGFEWHGTAEATMPPGMEPDSTNWVAPGSFSMSGTLTVEVIAEEGDVRGTPLDVRMDVDARLFWDKDPGFHPGTGVSKGHVSVSVGEIFVGVEGGQVRTLPRSWSSEYKIDSDNGVVHTTIGSSFTINIDASGTSGEVWVGGSGDFHGEIGADIGLMMVIEPPPATVSVKAQYDDAGEQTDDVFGTYLAGVSLPTKFTVTTGGSGIAKVKLAVEGLTKSKANEVDLLKAVPKNSRDVVFNLDPGYLKETKEYNLIATGYNLLGEEIAHFTGKIKMLDEVDLQLQVAPSNDSATLLNIDKARFLANIPTDMSFTAHIPNLPLQEQYQSRLSMAYIPANSSKITPLVGSNITNDRITFAASTSNFRDIANDNDYEFVLTAAKGKSVPSGVPLRSKTEQQVDVFTPPDWLKKSKTSKYNLVSDVTGMTSAYVIPITSLKLNKDLGFTPIKTPFGVFNNLSNSVNFDFALNAIIPLDQTKTPEVKRPEWNFNAKFLGDTVFDKKGALLDKSKITVTPNIDSQTLNFAGLTLSTPHLDLQSFLSNDLLFQRKIPSKSWSIPLPSFLSPPPLELSGVVSVDGNFEATATKLEVWSNIKINPDFNLDPEVSYFTVQAVGNATLSVRGSAALNAGILGLTPLVKSLTGKDLSVNIIDAAITGEATAKLDLKLQFGLGGSIFDPTIMGLNTDLSHAGLALGHQLDYDLDFLTSKGQKVSELPKKDVPLTKSIALFNLSVPPDMPPPSQLARDDRYDKAPDEFLLDGPSWTYIPAAGDQTSSGRVTGVVVDPSDPAVAYIGTASGGVFRTRDGGGTWLPLLDEAPAQANGHVLAVGALALIPTTDGRGTILLVGTGEGNRTANSLPGVGLYRILNAESETPTIEGPFNLDSNTDDVFTGRGITKIVVNPNDPEMIFVSTTSAYSGLGGMLVDSKAERGLYRSLNALGTNPTFSKLLVAPDSADVRVTDIVMEPSNPNNLVVAIQSFGEYGNGGIYRSTNATESVPSFTRMLVLPDDTNVKLAAAKVGTDVTIYAATSEGTPAGQLRRSSDGGVTWMTLPSANGFAGESASADLAVAVDASNPDIVYIGGSMGVMQSTNGGTTFADISDGLPPHTHAIVLAPSNSSVVYAGNNSGVWRSLTGGSAWENLNTATLTSTDAVRSAPQATGPGSPSPLYTGTDSLYRSLDQGVTRKLVSQYPLAKDILGRAIPLSSIAVSAQDDRVRVVALGHNPLNNRGNVFATTSGATKLKDITGSLPAGHISSITIDPADKNTAYVAVGNAVWQTTNLAALVASSKPPASSQWQRVGSGLPNTAVNSVHVDPADSNIVYAATNVGVYRSTNRSKTWTRFGNGLPPVAVMDLALDATNRTIIVTTLGRGQWSLPIPLSTPTSFTTPAAATFVSGYATTTMITTVGPGPVALSLQGKLPEGVTFTDNKDGTATLKGQPPTSAAKDYRLTITARTHQEVVTQVFTLTIARAPKLNVPTTASLPVGRIANISITTSGFPYPTLTTGSTLPTGLTFTDLGNGKATITGTPSAESSGEYSVVITANNGIGVPVQKTLKLVVTVKPTITSLPIATFTSGTLTSHTITTTGGAGVQLSVSGKLPPGFSFVDNHNGTATLSGIPDFQAGLYAVTIRAKSGTITVMQKLQLRVVLPLQINGMIGSMFLAGSSGSVTFTTIGGSARATLGVTGTLPTGITFTDNGNGTGTLSGTPTRAEAGEYDIVIRASNSVDPHATLAFHLTVGAAPIFTSADTFRFVVGKYDAFSVVAEGSPIPYLDMDSQQFLSDRGLFFNERTGILSGTPLVAGTFMPTFYASNGIGQAIQTFTLVIHQPLTFDSPTHGVAVIGNPLNMYVHVRSDGSPTLTQISGSLPDGLSYVEMGGDSGVITGTPAPGTNGTYTLEFLAHDGIDPDVTQTITLEVKSMGIVSVDHTEFQVNIFNSLGLLAQADPTGPYPVFSLAPESDPLPEGITLVPDEQGGAQLTGTAVAGSGGVYHLRFKATLGADEDFQDFTFVVSELPTFSNADHVTFQEGVVANPFLVTTTGFPNTNIVVDDDYSLPLGLTFVDQGDGTAILSGTPAIGTAGTYEIYFTVTNRSYYWGLVIFPQRFTLTIEPA